MKRADAREDIVRYSRLVHARGWVANHDGNLTLRLSPDRILATPTSFSKGEVSVADLIVVDASGNKVSGHRSSFSEIALHLAAYGARKDVKAVLHAHPPFATALAVAGRALDRPFMAEPVVSLGDCIPLVPYKLPKSPGWAESIAAHAPWYDALLLENHGVLTLGDDLEQAWLRMELVEHLATILHRSLAFGGPKFLPQSDVDKLLASHKRAGLGPLARGLGEPPHRSRPALAEDPSQITRIVLEEIERATRG